MDLCKPVSRKYEMAVSTILGRNIDAVVVDTEKTAIDCIEVGVDGLFLTEDYDILVNSLLTRVSFSICETNALAKLLLSPSIPSRLNPSTTNSGPSPRERD